MMKNWLDFGDLDLIFTVTAVEKLKIHSGGNICFLWKHLLVLVFFLGDKISLTDISLETTKTVSVCADPDQMPQNVVSDQGLHCLQIF